MIPAITRQPDQQMLIAIHTHRLRRPTSRHSPSRKHRHIMNSLARKVIRPALRRRLTTIHLHEERIAQQTYFGVKICQRVTGNSLTLHSAGVGGSDSGGREGSTPAFGSREASSYRVSQEQDVRHVAVSVSRLPRLLAFGGKERLTSAVIPIQSPRLSRHHR